jgi:2'-5' RNA ligase
MADQVRAFLALEIPERLRAELAASREALRAELPRARWVRPESQHLTLKFLGETPRATLEAIAAALAPRLAGLGVVAVRLHGSGVFPTPGRPRVAWIGGSADGIAPVVESVEEVAEAHGFPRERRPWSLHLTQARLDPPWPQAAVDRFLAWGGGLELEPFRCAEVVLFESRLERGGAVYTPLARMPLQ